MKNIKTKLFIGSLLTIIGFFISLNTASAQTVTPNCNSAMVNGYVVTNGNQASAWFEWGSTQYLGNSTFHQTFYTNSNLNQLISGLSSNTTYYYRLMTLTNYGTLVGETKSFRTSLCSIPRTPNVTTFGATNINTTSATLNGSVGSNSDAYVSAWFEWGTGPYFGNKTTETNYGNGGVNFNYYASGLTPNTIYYFRAVARNSYGQTVYGNQISFVTINNSYTNNYYYPNTQVDACLYSNCAPSAITTLATNIGGTKVRLNGIALVSNVVRTIGYFEYGTTTALGNATTNKNIGSTPSNTFGETLPNLSFDTTYYYRAVVLNQYGTSRGEIMNFRTAAYTNYFDTTVVVQNNNTVNTTNTVKNDTKENTKSSLVSLSIDRNGERINSGSVIEYTINYKNVSSKNLKDIVLQVTIPKELKFIEASRGTFSTENNTLLSNIGNLDKGDENNVRVRAQVGTDTAINKLVVVTTNLAYTVIGTDTQEETFAYTTNTIDGQVVNTVQVQQGALVLMNGNIFLPNSLLGWLLIILLIILIILSVRKAYSGTTVLIPVDNHNKGH